MVAKGSAEGQIIQEIGEAGPERILYVADAFRIGLSLEEVFMRITKGIVN